MTDSLKEQLTRIIKDTCHFSAEDGQCSTYHECDLTSCAYTDEQVGKILALLPKPVEPSKTLMEQIANLLFEYLLCRTKENSLYVASEILALGLVQLDKDQTPPLPERHGLACWQNKAIEAYQKAGWQKVKEGTSHAI